MKVPAQAVDIVKKWEGFVGHTYKDAVGVFTIGYGTTAEAGVGIIPVPGMTITERQATVYLMRGLEKFADQIRPAITAPINDNEFSAFLSLAYNIGPGAFRKSTALKRFNAGDRLGAAEALTWFDKAGGRTLKGLQKRRQEEKALFLTQTTRKPATGFLARLWAHIMDAIRYRIDRGAN